MKPQRNRFEMHTHNKSLEQYAPIKYKHRPALSNNWPSGVRD